MGDRLPLPWWRDAQLRAVPRLVAKATEILGDRWTLLIVREMLGGASGFNELQRGLPGISRSVLTDRMRALERAEVIERRTGPKGRNPGISPHAGRP